MIEEYLLHIERQMQMIDFQVFNELGNPTMSIERPRIDDSTFAERHLLFQNG